VLNQDLVPEQAAVVHCATELPATGIYSCPVPQCGGHSGTMSNLRQYFLMQHPQNLVCIPIKGSLPLPQCAHCGLQMLVEDLGRGNHCTGLCQSGWERQCQHEAAVHSQHALECAFSANREEFERVEFFKYMGRLILHDHADNQAMRSNPRKARGCWACVSCVLRPENATPKMCGMFYKATVHAVLLYRSVTWSLSPLSMKRLEGFHICATWQMSGIRSERNEDGSWTYPHLEDVLQALSLRPITHYVDVRQQTIANFIVNQTIYELCAGALRKRGLPF
jgi:hypothetical protein